ncbi:MAG TPA: flagellar protein [Negativicutes bacterium]|nr:flagellar protein [Negativicutes bacterium]
MAIINCKDCGKVCASRHSELCADCYKLTRQAEVKVSEYLDDNPGSTMEEIHQATGVERHIIMGMIRNGIIAAGAVKYPCENCRELIDRGRLCVKCAAQVLKVLEPRQPVRPEPEPEHRSSQMYTRRVLFGKG